VTRLRDEHRRKRRELGWYLAGFAVVQLGLAVGVDAFWPAVRDPDFEDLRQLVQQRQAENPRRPLALALGSSRTLMGLHTERLKRPADAAAPVVVNCAITGGGPMCQQVVLRRLLAANLRPDLVFVEFVPMSVSAGEGYSIEERWSLAGQYSSGEVALVWPYYSRLDRLGLPWGLARLIPIIRHRAELREAMRVDTPAAGRTPRGYTRDAYGWLPGPSAIPASDVQRLTREALKEYAGVLGQPGLAPGAVRAYRDVVKLCTEEHIRVVLVVPPEGNSFRSFAPAAAEAQMAVIRDLARELNLPLLDARSWVDDEYFWDGHHLMPGGADHYTERFGREVLQHLSASPVHWTTAPSWMISPQPAVPR
jgi:hypothetical protein